jgi:DNA-binding NarL/FixJ family response regulator
MALAIFLVEDDPLIREHFGLMVMEVLHARVVGMADNSDDALAWLAANDEKWDLTVLDLFLREGTGLMVLEGMNPAHKHRCVVLTNSPSPTNIARCLDLGAEAVFDKSLEVEKFLEYCTSLEAA